MSSPRPPSVDFLADMLYDGSTPRALVVEAVKRAISHGGEQGVGIESQARRILAELAASRPARVINAAGVLLHTNLGRAPWSAQSALDGMAAAGYGNVELDVQSGDRGTRGLYTLELLRMLCGADAALVVNNNAGALLLTLSVLASSRSVPVSRGELIEIGGSYRLPDLISVSGAQLVEVGTTNRTRLQDYEAAIDDSTGAILKVHPSNYRISGFTSEASLRELAQLAQSNGLPLIFDAGSGLLDATTPWLSEHPPGWLAGEPGVRQALDHGADLVLFSGDKLLGGPQAGVIVGNAELVGRLAQSPLARALRVDGVTLASLSATLEAYADRKVLDIPFWRMATTPYEVLLQRAGDVVKSSGVECLISAGVSTVGGGSAPGAELPSPLVEIPGSADTIYRRLLSNSPPVLARRVEGRSVVDLRAVDTVDDIVVSEAIALACRS